jgi:hypothetical protein
MPTFTKAICLPILEMTFTAEAAMATNYIAVKLGTYDGQVNIAGSAEAAIGILQTPAATAGDQVRVMILGISPVKANGDFSKGDLLGSAASTGLVDTATAAHHGIAIALEAAGAQNDIVSAFVCPQKYIAAT